MRLACLLVLGTRHFLSNLIGTRGIEHFCNAPDMLRPWQRFRCRSDFRSLTPLIKSEEGRFIFGYLIDIRLSNLIDAFCIKRFEFPVVGRGILGG